MSDRLVMLFKEDFDDKTWFKLSLEFNFYLEDSIAYIRVLEFHED